MTVENILAYHQETFQALLTMQSGLVVLSGPSASGKTTLIRELAARRPSVIVSSTTLTEDIYGHIRSHERVYSPPLPEDNEVVALEDIDYYLPSCVYQWMAASWISRIYSEQLVLLSGIFDRRDMHDLFDCLKYYDVPWTEFRLTRHWG